MHVKVKDLKPGMSNIDLIVRVMEVGKPKVVQTRSGERTISEVLVGDDTGRVKLTLWGRAVGSVHEGDAVEVRGAWTTAFKGNVQLNIGGERGVVKVDDSAAPKAGDVPESTPKAPQKWGGESRSRIQVRGFRGRRSR